MTREDTLILDMLVCQKNDFQRKKHMIIFYALASLLGRMGGFCRTDLDIINASAILEGMKCIEPKKNEYENKAKWFLLKAGYPESYFDDIVSLSSRNAERNGDKRKELLDDARSIAGCLESEDPRKEALKALKDCKSSTGLKLLMDLCLQPGF